MTDKIKANIGNPAMLEKFYREDRKNFKAEFDSIYLEIESTETARFWKARLDYENRPEVTKSMTFPEVILVIAICLVTALLVKIPAFFHLSYPDETFYEKNAALIVFFGLTLYAINRSHRINETGRVLTTGLAFMIPAFYVNFLPAGNSAAINLVYIHLPLLMWFVYGIVFTGYDLKDKRTRIDFIRYNGDLAIVYALIAIAGGILTAITLGLFQSIGLNIGRLYMQNIVLTGAAAAPIVATYLIEKFPALVSRTAPLIAAIFSPMVLITLLIFLATMIVTGKDPYSDRQFLLVFNLMLLGVMAIIIFSVSESPIVKYQKFNSVVLFILSIVTIIIDLIALSAIFYRLSEYGLTPNRLAVLVSNILILGNLVLITIDLSGINFKGREFSSVEKTVAGYLPAYLAWIIVVVFGFPFIFGMH